MRLLLTAPAGWRTVELSRRTVATASGGGAAIEWSPLLRLPDDAHAWMWRELRRDLAAGAVLLPVAERELRTATGWPLHLVEVDVTVGVEVREVRLAGFYAFFEHAAVAMVRAATRAALDRARAVVEGAMLHARPRFRDDAGVALARFWAPVIPATER